MTRKEERKDPGGADYLPESTVGSQSYRKAKPLREVIGAPSLAEPIVVGQALQGRIAEKAHELYEGRGRTHGHDLEDWFEAEKMVLAQQGPRAKDQRYVRPRRVRRSTKSR